NTNGTQSSDESKRIDHIGRAKGITIDINLDDHQLETVVLSDKPNIIKYIYHISDIHISKETKRHEEYRKVLERLYKKIINNDNDTAIVVTGDIINEMTILSSEQLLLVSDMLYNFSNI